MSLWKCLTVCGMVLGMTNMAAAQQVPLARQVDFADTIVAGKVTKMENKAVNGYKIYVIKVTQTLRGNKNKLTTIRLGTQTEDMRGPSPSGSPVPPCPAAEGRR